MLAFFGLNFRSQAKERDMRKTDMYTLIILVVLIAEFVFSCSAERDHSCEEGNTRGVIKYVDDDYVVPPPNYKPDDDTGDDTADDDTVEPLKEGDIVNGPWIDPDTGIAWAKPYMASDRFSAQYCGYVCEKMNESIPERWRSASITELRTLVRNCPNLETGGDCPLYDGASTSDDFTDKCRECGSDDAPACVLTDSIIDWWEKCPVLYSSTALTPQVDHPYAEAYFALNFELATMEYASAYEHELDCICLRN